MTGPASIPDSPDRPFVARLIAADSDAWSSVRKEILTPLFRADIRGIASQCARAGLSDDAVFSCLYANLSRDDFAPLRAFRFECAFSSWLYWHIWNAAQGAIREALGKLPSIPLDPDAPAPLPIATPPPPPPAGEAPLDEANRLLALLWARNPVYALVLVLRHDAELSSKEVAALLGKSPANIDQLNHRAQTMMRALRDAGSP